MKFFGFLVLLFSVSAQASQNLNHITCFYHHKPTGWVTRHVFNSKTSFSLADGEAAFLTRGWTGGVVGAPNYGYCARMIGTTDDNTVIIENFHYQAKSFAYMPPMNDCAVIGDTVELLSITGTTIQRGQYAQLESPWTPPHVDKIQVRQYFPKLDELDQLSQISAEKCAELTP